MSGRVKVLRNADVKRIVMFIPPSHEHVRMYIETDELRLILQEATIAAIVRAYINIITHPRRKAIELLTTKIEERKRGYAEHQLLESDKDESQIIKDMEKILASSE